MTTGKRSTCSRATWWWATTGRARAASSASHPPMLAGRPACITVRSHPEAGAFFTRSTTTMLKTGKEHLQSLRDGRGGYIGSEKVDDVDRKSGVEGKSGDLGGRRIIKKKKEK